jgi:hypothetical protein
MTLSSERIQQFVRLTLGCACPEEVFRHTICQHSVPLTDKLWLSHKIDIGSRLLIYVFTANNRALVMNVLPELVSIGKNERERKGYKRLRLVIASDHPDTISVPAKKTFNTLDSIDKKIDLHIIHSNELRL